MNKKKVKVVNKCKFICFILFILLVIVVVCIINKINIHNTVNTKVSSSKDVEEANTVTIENTILVDISDTGDTKKTDGKKKIDFLAKVTEPVYKKSEKTIKIPILIYHAFCTPIPYEDDVYRLFSSEANFEENVVALLDEGYTFINLEDLYRYENNEIGLPEKVVIITMDDGWLGCYTDAYTILQKYQIPATIFIVNTLVGTPGYFDWDQAKEMYDSGLVKIHCHGYSHISYGSVSKEKLQNDFTKSHKEIEEKLGESIQKIMAYPAGDSSSNSITWLKEIGFEVQVQTKYGTVNKSNALDLTGLGRIRAERATGKQILSAIKNAP